MRVTSVVEGMRAVEGREVLADNHVAKRSQKQGQLLKHLCMGRGIASAQPGATCGRRHNTLRGMNRQRQPLGLQEFILGRAGEGALSSQRKTTGSPKQHRVLPEVNLTVGN